MATEGRRILLIADEPIGRGLHAALADIDVERVRIASVDEVHAGATLGAIAYVWSAIGSERGFGRPVARMKAKADIPIYAVVWDDAPDNVARGLYRAGVSGVFSWPREGLLLARYVAEMLSLRLVRGPAGDADKSLGRTVRAHLRHLPMAGIPLSVEVQRGRVALSGNLESLVDRDEIERRISMVPGVESLDVSAVHVRPVPVADSQIRTACRRLIASQSDPDTVTAVVRNGVVRFEGALSRARDVEQLREMAARVRGVREIEMAIRVSPGEARRARGVQRRLEGLMQTLYADVQFELACHGEVAVIEGRVPTLHIKRSMGRLLEQEPGLTRVVNKLIVDP